MTGFGEAEEATDAGLVRVEMKTVNHRFFNASLRTPTGFDRIEADIQSWLRSFIGRGHVTYSLAVDRGLTAGDLDLPELDLDKATRYKELLEILRTDLDLAGAVELSDVARFGEIFRAPPPTSPTADVDEAVIKRLTEAAAAAVVHMRETEGARLQADLEERLAAITTHLSLIERRAPERLIEERNRLRDAVAELIEGHSADEDRLAREIAYLAEKWDINEEFVRFRSHVELFGETLAVDPPEPVGKRLGFVIQEMNREANTIGSKANDAEISQAAVSLKEEIERLREQLENVE
jgi:uncharacterized protein (TIGR00255 family)